MRRIIAAFVAAAAFIVAAYAAEVEGNVESINLTTRTVTLDGGQVFIAVEGVAIAQLEPGTRIRMTVDDVTRDVTSIEKL